MTQPDVHPGEEALAAYAGGPADAPDAGTGTVPAATTDPERVPSPGAAAIEAHLTGCARCRDEVGQLRTAARQLALLTEPELPAGLHDRLVAAVRAELAGGQQPVAAGLDAGTHAGAGPRGDADPDIAAGDADAPVSAPADLAAAGRRRRAAARRRAGGPFGWAVAAAAVVLLGIAGITQLDPLMDQLGGGKSADIAFSNSEGGSAGESPGGGSGSSGSSGSGSSGGAAAAPRFSAKGDYDLDRFASDLETWPDLRAAYDRTVVDSRRAAGTRITGESSDPDQATPPSTPSQQQGSDGGNREPAPLAGGEGTCQPPIPADARMLLIDAEHEGVPATIAVVVRGEPPVTTLFAFDRAAFDQGACVLLGELGELP